MHVAFEDLVWLYYSAIGPIGTWNKASLLGKAIYFFYGHNGRVRRRHKFYEK